MAKEVDSREKELTHQVHREWLQRASDQVKQLTPALISGIKIFITTKTQGVSNTLFTKLLQLLNISFYFLIILGTSLIDLSLNVHTSTATTTATATATATTTTITTITMFVFRYARRCFYEIIWTEFSTCHACKWWVSRPYPLWCDECQ